MNNTCTDILLDCLLSQQLDLHDLRLSGLRQLKLQLLAYANASKNNYFLHL